MEARTLYSVKALPSGPAPTRALTLVFDGEPPSLGDNGDRRWTDLQLWYEHEGAALVAALGEHLPQGLMRGILVAMLRREGCILGVADIAEIERLRAENRHLLDLNADLSAEIETEAARRSASGAIEP